MREVYRTIENGKDRLCEQLMELIRIPTVNPPGMNYTDIAGLLQERCRRLGLETRVVPVPEKTACAVVANADTYPRINLMARWHTGAAKTVHFNAHFDVVPVSGGWRIHPFQPQRIGNWLLGRGANDMKDSIAALLFAIAALKENGRTPAFNIECSFTCDEETGGELGAGFLVRNGWVSADFAVCCEGEKGRDVGIGHNGALWLHVGVNGRAAHGSRPEKGVNAFEKMSQLVVGLQALKGKLAQPRRAFVSPSGKKRYPTINLGGVFRGSRGDKINTVPSYASFSIDRRVLPNERIETAEAEMRDAIGKICRSDRSMNVDVRTILRIAPCLVDPEHPFARAFASAVRRVRRHAVSASTSTGFTDLHYFTLEGGMPGVGYGPRGKGAHGANERVFIPDLVRTAKIYAAFMMTPLAGK